VKVDDRDHARLKRRHGGFRECPVSVQMEYGIPRAGQRNLLIAIKFLALAQPVLQSEPDPKVARTPAVRRTHK